MNIDDCFQENVVCLIKRHLMWYCDRKPICMIYNVKQVERPVRLVNFALTLF